MTDVKHTTPVKAAATGITHQALGLPAMRYSA